MCQAEHSIYKSSLLMTQKHPYLHQFISLITCSFLIFCLLIGKGYNYPAIVLLTLAFLTLPFWCKKNILTLPVILISASFIFYFATHLLSWIVHNGKMSDLDQVSRLVLVLPILLMLIRFPINKKWLLYSVCVGAIIAGTVAIIHVFQMDLHRAFSGDNSKWWQKGYMPIQSGNMAMTLGFLSLPIAIYALKVRQPVLLTLGLLGFFGGVLASFLSGSRGAWIAIPFVLVYLLWSNKSLLNKKALLVILIIISSSIISILSIDRVQNRILTAIIELQQYEQDNKYSSLGIRMELWKSALLTFKTSPLIGVGEVKRHSLQKEFGDQGLIDYQVAHNFFSHSHNQYLDDLSVRGLIGFLALIFLFFVPVKLVLYQLKATDNPEHPLAQQLMISHIILFSFYQMTQSMFSHNSGTVFFSFITIILFSFMHNINYDKCKN